MIYFGEIQRAKTKLIGEACDLPGLPSDYYEMTVEMIKVWLGLPKQSLPLASRQEYTSFLLTVDTKTGYNPTGVTLLL
ncbi:MAG: hypothetical protein HYR76_06315 [Ignavibacteria bacterium]|nr:hypothetical protein [Ignavibacteria bacterium]